MRTDLLVLGGGAAGLAAARTARRLGKSVVLVQDGPVGGDCTFTGCVPSKTLIAAAAQGLDLVAAMEQVRATVDLVAATETADVLRREGITVLAGRARFTGAHTVVVDGQSPTGGSVTGDKVVIATGSEPSAPDVPGLAEAGYLTTDDLWATREPVDRWAVLGGGPAGCEIAQALARFDSRVTLVEQADRLLPCVDAHAAAVVTTALGHDGVEVRTGLGVRRAEQEDDGVQLTLSDGSQVRVDRVVVATGRRPRTAGLGLEVAGVETGPAGEVVTDERTRTSADGVLAAGDVTGRFVSTPAADESGRTAALNALQRGARMRVHEEAVPRVVFTDPEVAWVGVPESAAPSGSRVAHLPMSAVDRARADGRTEGFLTLVAAPRTGLRRLGGGRLVGAVVVAPHAGELIGELTLAVRTGMFTGRLAQAVHPYPTYATALRSCAAQFLFEQDGRRARPARSTP